MKCRTLKCITATTLLAALAVPVHLAAQQTRYTVTDLGTLGGTFSQAVGVNNQGSISGFSTLPGDSVIHGFLWQKGEMIDLGTLGGPNSFAPEEWPPNDRGEVAGFSDTSILDPDGENFCSAFTFVASPYICRPFVWRHGTLTELPTLGGNNAAAVAINNRGEVVGASETGTATDCFPHYEAVLWGPNIDEIHRLPPLFGDTEAVTTGINDSGQVVGTSGNCTSGPIEAVLWQNGQPVNVGSLGGAVFNIAFGINNRGQVVGQSDLPGDTTHHAFFWEDGAMTDLGTFGGLPVSLATSINNKGQVVGFSQEPDGNNTVACLWENGLVIDLNTVISADSPWFLIEALGINDRGQVVGYAFNASTGEVHGFLATPVPGSESATGAAQGQTRERPKIVLPENVRKLLQQRPGFGRFLKTAQDVASISTALTSTPNAALLPTSLTFSTQAIGTTSAAKTVTLKNTGTTSLTITAIAISGTNAGNFAQTHTCGSSLVAGAICSISVTFKPTVTGTRTAALSITDNAAGSPQQVPLGGIGTTAKLFPTSLNFGTVAIGTTSPAKTVTLTNVGTTTMSITGLAITGINAGDFAQTHTCGSSLAAGATCSINITFKPTASGTRTASLSVSDNAAGSPQTVSLIGNCPGGTCSPRGAQCAPKFFPPCCPGLACVRAFTRAFCEP